MTKPFCAKPDSSLAAKSDGPDRVAGCNVLADPRPEPSSASRSHHQTNRSILGDSLQVMARPAEGSLQW